MNEEQYAKTLGKNIVARRLKLELSQEDVARSSKISVMTISRIENGETNATVATLNKIAKSLKTDAKKLLP